MNVGLLSSASALAICGYTGSVIYHGNLIALLNQLAKDKAFLAWMAAAGLLYFLSQQDTIGVPVRLITGTAILAFLLKIFSGNTNVLGSVFSDFAAGKISFAQLFTVFATTAGTKLGIYQGSVSAYSTPTGAK
jgi:hypothetical protein